tara:strand:+ start:44 stop:358 length:315 start_codon:yes stop_codon:yes gene_type:complete
LIYVTSIFEIISINGAGRVIILTLFLVNFGYIFLKAFQQRNVAQLEYWPVPLMSYLMAACEVFSVSYVASTGFAISNIVAIGTGGAMGSMIAMYMHSKMFKKRA